MNFIPRKKSQTKPANQLPTANDDMHDACLSPQQPQYKMNHITHFQHPKQTAYRPPSDQNTAKPTQLVPSSLFGQNLFASSSYAK
jgi:hypothetical protein